MSKVGVRPWSASVGAALGFLVGVAPAFAQAPPAAPPPPAAAAPPPWQSQCSASKRTNILDCAIEQRAVISETGQLLMIVSIRVPGDSRKPVLMVQAPTGPFLPAGVIVDVDGQPQGKLEYQTCDLKGCYAGSPVSDALLAAMFKGQKLTITIQTLNKQPINVPMSLSGFTAAFRDIQ